MEEVSLVQNLNVTLENLGGDVERLEERGHGRLQRGRTSGNNDVDLRDGTSLGSSRHLIRHNILAHSRQVSVGEDESNVELADLTDLLELLHALLLKLAKDTTHLGILTAVDHSLATHGFTDLMELVGGDVVNTDDEELGVVGEVRLELISENFLTGFGFLGCHD